MLIVGLVCCFQVALISLIALYFRSSLTMDKKMDLELSMFLPNEESREKIVNGVFDRDVLDVIYESNVYAREAILEWIEERHGKIKADELRIEMV